jgi:hypothetical protein
MPGHRSTPGGKSLGEQGVAATPIAFALGEDKESEYLPLIASAM